MANYITFREETIDFDRVMGWSVQEEVDDTDDTGNQLPEGQWKKNKAFVFTLDTPFFMEDDSGNPLTQSELYAYEDGDKEKPLFRPTGHQVQKQTITVSFENLKDFEKAVKELNSYVRTKTLTV